MDGVIIFCALLGITAEVSRRMWRAFGTGDVEEASPRAFNKTRVEIWLEQQDWEKLLGFRYDWRPAPAPIRVEQRTAAPYSLAPSVLPNRPVRRPQSEANEDDQLIDRLEEELARAAAESFTDTLFTDFAQPVEEEEPPEPEELIQLKDVIVVARFATIEESVGLPVGAPDVFELEIPATPKSTASEPVTAVDFRVGESGYQIAASLRRSLDESAVASHHEGEHDEAEVDPLADVIAHALAEEAPAEDPNALELPLEPLNKAYQPDLAHAGEPVGAPGVCEIGIPPRVTAMAEPVSSIPVEPSLARSGRVIEGEARVGSATMVTGGQPIGDPGIHFEVVAKPLIALPKAAADNQIAANDGLVTKDYAIAAYSIQPGSGPSRDPVTGEETEPTDESTFDEEIIAELLKEEEPAEDPNALELPLNIPDAAELAKLQAGQPVGDPGVIECVLPKRPVADAGTDSSGQPEPSAPIDVEINRISEKVENILSSALARPAPAINFQDALADLTAKAKERKKAEAEAEANRLPSRAVEDNLSNSADRSGGLKMTEYKVQFEVFEGPLDLLLYLVRKQEVDIYEVNLTQIAEEFIRYIDLMRELDLEVAGEFLVMASTLMYIKSKELLPVEQQSVSDEDEEEEDPRWELIRQLVEYKKFKDAAAEFKTLELAQEDVFPRNPPKPDFPVEHVKPNVSVFDLIGAVNKILARIDAKETREIFADRWTVSEKIEIIRNQVLEKEKVMFSDLFEDVLSRTEVVATFLAVLELIKLKVIVVEQPDTFSDIEICKSPPGHTLDINSDAETELPLAADEAAPASEFDAPPAAEE